MEQSTPKLLSRWYGLYRKVDSDGFDEKFEDDDSTIEGIPLDDEDARPRRQRKLIFITAFSVCSAVFLLFLGVVMPPLKDQAQNGVSPCGNSTKEALSQGCWFDQLTLSWLPAQCPHYMNEDFLAAEHWKYYTSREGGDSVSIEGFIQALDEGKELWTERREHLTHCVYMFLSVAHIAREKTRYNPMLMDYSHLHHCAKLILGDLKQTQNWTEIETKVPAVNYRDC
jgi:hypothetical protein